MIRGLAVLVLGLGLYAIYINLLDIVYLTDEKLIADSRNNITKIAVFCTVYLLHARVTLLEQKLNE